MPITDPIDDGQYILIQAGSITGSPRPTVVMPTLNGITKTGTPSMVGGTQLVLTVQSPAAPLALSAKNSTQHKPLAEGPHALGRVPERGLRNMQSFGRSHQALMEDNETHLPLGLLDLSITPGKADEQGLITSCSFSAALRSRLNPSPEPIRLSGNLTYEAASTSFRLGLPISHFKSGLGISALSLNAEGKISGSLSQGENHHPFSGDSLRPENASAVPHAGACTLLLRPALTLGDEPAAPGIPQAPTGMGGANGQILGNGRLLLGGHLPDGTKEFLIPWVALFWRNRSTA